MLMSLSVFGQQKGLNYQAVILDPNTIEIPGQVISGQPFSKGELREFPARLIQEFLPVG